MRIPQGYELAKTLMNTGDVPYLICDSRFIICEISKLPSLSKSGLSIGDSFIKYVKNEERDVFLQRKWIGDSITVELKNIVNYRIGYCKLFAFFNSNFIIVTFYEQRRDFLCGVDIISEYRNRLKNESVMAAYGAALDRAQIMSYAVSLFTMKEEFETYDVRVCLERLIKSIELKEIKFPAVLKFELTESARKQAFITFPCSIRNLLSFILSAAYVVQNVSGTGTVYIKLDFIDEISFLYVTAEGNCEWSNASSDIMSISGRYPHLTPHLIMCDYIAGSSDIHLMSVKDSVCDKFGFVAEILKMPVPELGFKYRDQMETYDYDFNCTVSMLFGNLKKVQEAEQGK